MAFRLKLIIIVAGGALGYIGYEEYTVSSKTGATPMEVELADLEKSTQLENNFVRIGKHWSLYPATIYEYETDSHVTRNPPSNSKVNHAYYPIISNSHPIFFKIQQLFVRYGNEANIPDDQWPDINQFTVLVKTNKFKTIGSIPDDWVESDLVQGLVINRIENLDSEEKNLIRQNFPQIDLEQVLIVEQDREPSSRSKSWGMMGGGGILILLGVFLFFKKKAQTE